jgi:ribosome-associated protein
MIHVCGEIHLDERDMSFEMIRAQGAGGQNVNKVASAVQLRYDIRAATTLPPEVKQALLELHDRRISKDGVIVIKAQTHRSQDKNRTDAMERLVALVRTASQPDKPRKPTRPTRSSQQQRVRRKVAHGMVKQLRAKLNSRYE